MICLCIFCFWFEGGGRSIVVLLLVFFIFFLIICILLWFTNKQHEHNIYLEDTIKIQDRIRLIKKYGLTQFDSGNYTLPSQRIIINNNPFDTDSVQVEVAKVVVDTTKQKMFHIKPTFEVENPGFDIEKLFWWLIPILFLIAIGTFFYLKKRKREETKHQLPPYEEAIRALQELD